MAIKKSELYSSLWKSCDELRGGMDASQYKDYVLVLLFMKSAPHSIYRDRPSLPLAMTKLFRAFAKSGLIRNAFWKHPIACRYWPSSS